MLNKQAPTLRNNNSNRVASSISSRLFSSSSSSSDLNGNFPYDEECDVLVLGSGPAARAIATLLSSPKNSNLDVILADSNYDRQWAPNYGVWEDEWQSIVSRYDTEFGRELTDACIDHKWSVTDCYFGGSFDIPTEERLRVDRPYYRVDKNALQSALSPNDDDDDDGGDTTWYKVLKANHVS